MNKLVWGKTASFCPLNDKNDVVPPRRLSLFGFPCSSSPAFWGDGGMGGGDGEREGGWQCRRSAAARQE